MTESHKQSAVNPQPAVSRFPSRHPRPWDSYHTHPSALAVPHNPQSAIRNPQLHPSRPSPLAARRSAFTLVEIAIAIAVIAVLVVIITMVTVKARDAAKVKQTKAILQSLKLAMDECKGADSPLPPPAHYYPVYPAPPLAGWNALPPTANDPSGNVVRTDYYRSVTSGSWTPITALTADYPHGSEGPIDDIWALPDPKVNEPPGYSDGYPNDAKLKIYGIQLLYAMLMQEPRSKQVLMKLPESSFARASTLTEFLPGASDYFIGRGPPSIPRWRINILRPREALAILDAWGRPLHYCERPNISNGQPYVQSAGPDGVFDNDDDVYNFKD